jgi:hypothetical protein
MEEKTVKVIMPKSWNPKRTFTLQECAVMSFYINEKRKKIAEEKKSGKKVGLFAIEGIMEMFKQDEIKLDNPKQVYESYLIDDRCKQIVQNNKVMVFLGITNNCTVIQLQYPSPADQHSQYTDLIYNYVNEHAELFDLPKKDESLLSNEKDKGKIENIDAE